VVVTANNSVVLGKGTLGKKASFATNLEVIGGVKTFYKIGVIGTHLNGKKLKKHYVVLLKPFVAQQQLDKKKTLIKLHQRRVVEQLLQTKIKNFVETSFYSANEVDVLSNLFKNNNTVAGLENKGPYSAVTSGQRAALKYYKGSGYLSINKYLRFGEKPAFNSYACDSSAVSAEADIKACVALIDGLYSTVGAKHQLATTQDIRLYRGGYMDPTFDENTPQTFKEKSYLSVSLNKSTPLWSFYQTENSKFLNQLLSATPFYVKKTAALWRVLVPKGTKILYLENLCDGLFTHENEVLLPRGSEFEIIENTQANKSFYDYIPLFNAFTECEICGPNYDAYRTVDVKLITSP
jgi:hypothetical protein